jgi:hypothetical protein
MPAHQAPQINLLEASSLFLTQARSESFSLSN